MTNLSEPILVGKYLLIDLLSSSRPFYIYRAVDTTEKTFTSFKSLKTFHPENINRQPYLTELKRESEILSRLKYKGFPSLHENGEISGQYFHSYQHIWGKSLLKLLRELKKHNKMLSESYASYIISQVCSGLRYIHGLSDNNKPLVHGNINPHNIVISYTGEVFLVGFGHSIKEYSREDFYNSDFRIISYTAPEVFTQNTYTVESEIFSLGSIFYELITGLPPYMEKSHKKVINRIIKGTYIPATQVNTHLPDFIDDVFARSITPFIGDRFSTVDDFEKGIINYISDKQSFFAPKKMAKLMQTVFKSEIIEEIRYFQSLENGVKSHHKELFHSIPVKLIKSLEKSISSDSGFKERSGILSALSNEKRSDISFSSRTGSKSRSSNSIPSLRKSVNLPSEFNENFDPENSFFSKEDTEILGNEFTMTSLGNEKAALGPSEENMVKNNTDSSSVDVSRKKKIGSTDNIHDNEEQQNKSGGTLIMGSTAFSQVKNQNPEKEKEVPTVKTENIQGTRSGNDFFIGKNLGEYLVTGVIGWGGMGTVYEGIQPTIGKEVAIKVLKPSISDRKGVARRFLDEAKAVNSIRNPHIIDIFSFGIMEERYHYFVMERLHGESLGEYLKNNPNVSVKTAHDIYLQLFSAIEQAHEKGIIHRDIKPDNIFIEKRALFDTYVKVLDFGIAKFTDSDFKTAITKAGAAIGTPLYMSPEQALGKEVCYGSDIYSIGVIMYEMFTGSLPFIKKSYLEVLQAHLLEEPPRPSSIRPMDPRLEEIILWTLKKKTDERPANISVLRESLLPLLKTIS
ncbi:MAG: protein kinase [Deltaproteobacteria bacterium]|nr:protein kinase [Deltaproteobacteria bacterium]